MFWVVSVLYYVEITVIMVLRFYRKISKSRFSRLRSSIWEKWWVLDYVSWPFITEIDVLWYLKDTSAHLAPCWWSVITILIKFRETGRLVRPLLKKGWATGTLRVFQPIGSMLVKTNHTFSWYLIDYLDQHAINCQFLPKFFASNASSFFEGWLYSKIPIKNSGENGTLKPILKFMKKNNS